MKALLTRSRAPVFTGHRGDLCPSRKMRGLTLIELLVATAIGALLLAGMTSVTRLALLSRAEVTDSLEAVYQARFALERVSLAARATAPPSQPPATANTSGSWFNPVKFCVNSAAALIETTATDTGCTGTQIVAERVSSFGVSLPSGASAIDAAAAVVSITTGGASGNSVTLSERVRFGGGEL